MLLLLIMWNIYEHKSLGKACKSIPKQVLKKYELWKDLVYRHGPEILTQFSGFNDEKLVENRLGQRSSRLNIPYRVIYQVVEEAVYVLEISPHRY